MKFVIACVMALTLAACSDSNSNKNGTGNNGQNGDQGTGNNSMKNETNYSVCGTTTTRSGIEGRWYLHQSQDQFLITTMLTIRQGSMELANYCKFQDKGVWAQVRVPVTYSNGVLEILSSAERTEKLTEKDFSLDCSVAVEKSQITYHLQGNCLALQMPGTNEMVFVPQ